MLALFYLVAGGLRLLNRTQANEDACWEVWNHSRTPEWPTCQPISVFHRSGMRLSQEPLYRFFTSLNCIFFRFRFFILHGSHNLDFVNLSNFLSWGFGLIFVVVCSLHVWWFNTTSTWSTRQELPNVLSRKLNPAEGTVELHTIRCDYFGTSFNTQMNSSVCGCACVWVCGSKRILFLNMYTVYMYIHTDVVNVWSREHVCVFTSIFHCIKLSEQHNQ